MSHSRSCLADSPAAFFAAILCACASYGQYVETTRGCISCHESPMTKSDFCDATPASVWRQDDKHARAFTLLHEADSPDPAARSKKQQLVRQILGFDLRDAFVDDRYSRLIHPTDDAARQRVSTVKACLRCHGTWPKEADELSASTPPVPLELGVSCQACHGPGQQWLTPHFSDGWRCVTPAGKDALGYADCRSPIAKARLCASCHVGNIAADKFVKHEWYAAGHPPLPSFELASFQAQMPAHWKSLREKGPFKYRETPSTGEQQLPLDQRLALERAGVPAEAIKDSYVAANFPEAIAKGLNPVTEMAGFRDAVVGGAAIQAMYAKIINEYTALAAEGKMPWPELALYDCSACHHELRSGLASQTRPQRHHAPGRPPLATWPAALSRLALHQAENFDASRIESRAKSLQTLFANLDKAATTRPFGDPAAMSTAGNALADATDQLAADATATRFDERTAAQAIPFLTNSQNYEACDFNTARQVAWALTAITNDAAPGRGRLLFSQTTADPLALVLPSGPSHSIMQNLQRWLPAASHYDPLWFQRELSATQNHQP
jgi:hypothetical protein